MIGFYLFERVEDFFSLGKDGVDRVHENVALVVQRFWKKIKYASRSGFRIRIRCFFLNFSGSGSGRYQTGSETLNNDIKCKMKIYKPSGTGRMRGYNFVRDGDSVQLMT